MCSSTHLLYPQLNLWVKKQKGKIWMKDKSGKIVAEIHKATKTWTEVLNPAIWEVYFYPNILYVWYTPTNGGTQLRKGH